MPLAFAAMKKFVRVFTLLFLFSFLASCSKKSSTVVDQQAPGTETTESAAAPSGGNETASVSAKAGLAVSGRLCTVGLFSGSLRRLTIWLMVLLYGVESSSMIKPLFVYLERGQPSTPSRTNW